MCQKLMSSIFIVLLYYLLMIMNHDSNGNGDIHLEFRCVLNFDPSWIRCIHIFQKKDVADSHTAMINIRLNIYIMVQLSCTNNSMKRPFSFYNGKSGR